MFFYVESKMGALVLGFWWVMTALSLCRLSPTYYDSVSHPPQYIVAIVSALKV